jgi:hypothetical protein
MCTHRSLNFNLNLKLNQRAHKHASSPCIGCHEIVPLPVQDHDTEPVHKWKSTLAEPEGVTTRDALSAANLLDRVTGGCALWWSIR